MLFKENVDERELHKEHKLLILAIFPAFFMIYGAIISFFEYNHFEDFLEGVQAIVFSPTLLITDFMEVGGLGATFLMSGSIGFLLLYIIKAYKLRVNGLLIAAFFTVLGFSFFGKNIVNILPIFIGGFLYSRYQKIPFKNIIAVVFFGTALSPLVSELMFSGIIPYGYHIPAGIAIGIFIGFVVVPLSTHMLRFHDGFNMYNIGFTAGIIGTVITSFLRNMKISVEPVSYLYLKNEAVLWVGLVFMFVIYILAGLYIRNFQWKDYPKIFKHKGRVLTDFTYLEGYGLTFMNMGIMGLLSLLLVASLGAVLNGPVLAGVLTIVGFSALGKHLRNCAPVMLGVMVAALIFEGDLSSTPIVISILFSTTIAPIAGGFGPFIGILAGILHYILVTNVGAIHGGMNLYNNGFAGGLVAGFLVPILDAFRKGDHAKS